MSYRVLSLWQPWATLCIAPHELTGKPPKQYETRSWQPRIPVPFTVVIHATSRWGRDNAACSIDPVFREVLKRCGYLAGPTTRLGALAPSGLRGLPFGALLGIAHVVDVFRTEDVVKEIGDIERVFGDYTPGRFAWQLKDAYPLQEPIPFKGKQEPLYLLNESVGKVIDDQFQGRTA